MPQTEKTDPPEGRPAADDGYLDFRESVLLAWKARGYVLGAVLAGGLAGFGLGSIQPRLYESTVRLREETLTADEAPVSKAAMALLKGRDLAEAAAAGAGLEPEAVAAATTVEETAPPSSSVTLRVRLPDPVRTVDLANRLAEEAVALGRRAGEERTARTLALLERREAEARERVAAARAGLVAFLRENPRRGAGRGVPAAGSSPGGVERRGAYTEEDAAFDRMAIDVGVAEALYRDAAKRKHEEIDKLALRTPTLRVVERAAAPATPLSRGRLRKAVLGAAAGAVLALVGLFALLIARPPVEPAGPPA